MPSNRLAAISKYQCFVAYEDVGREGFGGYGLAEECRVSWLRAFSDLFFTGERSAKVQKITIAENALGSELADRRRGRACLRDIRKNDVTEEWKINSA
ncbi:hypothetical protein P3W85_27705 [Cupriavidus basilensis]|uniref:Mobile element protein n=1 Tax=Cupriavidus basilensis TaxID=68895 RepID=A0ABT6AWI1_9BURK|nr:hypothetical protein [Cupriavidus basilensis]MDF3836713.1 hypothetical protein [Cupriavidus basilensis]